MLQNTPALEYFICKDIPLVEYFAYVFYIRVKMLQNTPALEYFICKYIPLVEYFAYFFYIRARHV